MKFGLESEKFIFNLESNRPSKGVFSFLDALSDFQTSHSTDVISKATNEFVLSMVEIGTKPSSSPMEVLKDYLFNFLMIQSVALREQVALAPLGSLPMNYLPHMTPKWAYFVQNSILANRKQESWTMNQKSPLKAAGNCAGMHVHIEIETPPEFLFSNRELQDKFNMGLMMTPLIAFGSSPYFFGSHQAFSMRGHSYFHGVYKNLPLNGGLPPVMNSSIEVLNFVHESIKSWIERGVKLGFSRENLQRLTSKKGANWNPLRWNRQWNTIEIRCLDSDSLDMDASKFIWISSAMKRMDLKGEALICSPIKTKTRVDKKMIDECFETSGRRVCILPTAAIQEIFSRAIKSGTRDRLVEQYLHRLANFATYDLEQEYRWVFKILKRALNTHQTTSEILLRKTRNRSQITETQAEILVNLAIAKQEKIIQAIQKHVPEVFSLLAELGPSF